MGLTSKFYIGNVLNEHDDTELASFYKEEFIHSFFVNKHLGQGNDERDLTLQVTLAEMLELHKALCDKQYQESLDLDLPDDEVVVSFGTISLVKDVIYFMKLNPNEPVCYEGIY